MLIAKFGTAFVAGLILIAAAQPVLAASPITDAFLANVRPNVDFLDRSSRLAAVRSGSAPTRDFARSEVTETTRVAAALDVLMPGDRSFVVAAASTGAADGMITGRSAARDAAPGPLLPGLGQAANARRPVGLDEIAQLRTLSGRAFDDLYWEKQLDALSQLRADYRAYIAAGDDTALVAIARRELPKVEHRLLMLTRI